MIHSELQRLAGEHDRLDRIHSARISPLRSAICKRDDEWGLWPIDATTASGCKAFSIFPTLAEFEREPICKPTNTGLADAVMAQPDTSVSTLCKDLGIERVNLSMAVQFPSSVAA